MIENRRKIYGNIKRKSDAPWNRFLEGFWWIFGLKMNLNQRKIYRKLDRTSNTSWSQSVGVETTSYIGWSHNLWYSLLSDIIAR